MKLHNENNSNEAGQVRKKFYHYKPSLYSKEVEEGLSPVKNKPGYENVISARRIQKNSFIVPWQMENDE